MPQDFSLGTVEVALKPLERFAEFLQSRGKRITVQRRIIVEQVSRRHEHFDAGSHSISTLWAFVGHPWGNLDGAVLMIGAIYMVVGLWALGRA